LELIWVRKTIERDPLDLGDGRSPNGGPDDP